MASSKSLTELFGAGMLKVAMCTVVAVAGVPEEINLQGRLTNSSGTPLSGTYATAFRIYDVAVGGTVLWAETTIVVADSGLFNIILGQTNPIDPGIFDGSARWLGTTILGDPELAPRIKLVTVPHAAHSLGADIALNAVNADELGGRAASEYSLTDHQHAMDSLTDVIAPSPSDGQVLTWNGTGSVWEPQAPSGGGGDGWTDDGGVIRLTTSSDQVGIGTTTPEGPLHVAEGSAGPITANADAIAVFERDQEGYLSLLTQQIFESGILFEQPGQPANGGIIYNHPTARKGMAFRTGGNATRMLIDSSGNVGVGTSTPLARLHSIVSADTADLTYGLRSEADNANPSSSTVGVWSAATGNGVNIAVQGQAVNGVDNYGGLFSGTNYGVYSQSPEIGVRGVAFDISTLGIVGISGEATNYGTGACWGVAGTALGVGTSNIGVYGSASGATVDWAGYFQGDVNVSGTLSKSAGSFRIDHPLDPENKYLQHSFVESPDMMNIYNGNVVTGDGGFAKVEMPEWFNSLNRDFRYQLTVIGEFAQAIIAEEVSDNQFTIRTDKPGIKVSWQVTGIRRDAYAEANRIEVELDKQPDEKGKYRHPEAFGLPVARGVDHSHMVEAPRQLESHPKRPTHLQTPVGGQ